MSDDDTNPWMIEYDPDTDTTTFPDEDNIPLSGNGGLPLVSDQTSSSPAGSMNQMGSGGTGFDIGSFIKNLPKTAADIGTAVGAVEHAVAQAKTNYSTAQTAAASGNSLATWWLYASTTDKLLVGLTALTIVVMVLKKSD